MWLMESAVCLPVCLLPLVLFFLVYIPLLYLACWLLACFLLLACCLVICSLSCSLLLLFLFRIRSISAIASKRISSEPNPANDCLSRSTTSSSSRPALFKRCHWSCWSPCRGTRLGPSRVRRPPASIRGPRRCHPPRRSTRGRRAVPRCRAPTGRRPRLRR